MVPRPSGEPSHAEAPPYRRLDPPPPSDQAILAPIKTEFGVLQVRALPEFDTHALFLAHDRGECILVMHPNGYSCHEVAKRMAAKDEVKVRGQVQHILDCGGLSMGINFILGWMFFNPASTP